MREGCIVVVRSGEGVRRGQWGRGVYGGWMGFYLFIRIGGWVAGW